MDGDGISLAVGGGAVGVLASVATAWIKARFSKTQVEPNPLPVETKKKEEYVRVEEFAKHVAENERAHENLEARMVRNDRETSELKGMMKTALDDLSIIKTNLLRKGGK